MVEVGSPAPAVELEEGAESRAGHDGYPDCHGNVSAKVPFACSISLREVNAMNGIIYLVGLVVVILAILSFLGLR
jgi:hypothetical protein